MIGEKLEGKRKSLYSSFQSTPSSLQMKSFLTSSSLFLMLVLSIHSYPSIESTAKWVLPRVIASAGFSCWVVKIASTPPPSIGWKCHTSDDLPFHFQTWIAFFPLAINCIIGILIPMVPPKWKVGLNQAWEKPIFMLICAVYPKIPKRWISSWLCSWKNMDNRLRSISSNRVNNYRNGNPSLRSVSRQPSSF